MSPVNVGEVVIVPSWFGMEPSDIRSAINELLTRSGGKRSGDHFTLDGAALGRLRREGIGIRIDRRIRRTNAQTRRNSEHIDEVRSWMAMTRASISAQRIEPHAPAPSRTRYPRLGHAS